MAATPKATIRTLAPDDSIEELTDLLHRAYKTLADQGWNATGSYQTIETTRYRIAEGTCYVAELAGRIVGTALLITAMDGTKPPLYGQPGVAVLGQFAVEPVLRGQGLGSELIDTVSTEALRRGYQSLALDTVETATSLVEYYEKRGFKAVDHFQWRDKTYRSLVMVKGLGQRGFADD